MTKITMFKKEWLKDIKIINKPMSKVALTVAASVTERNYIPPTEPGKSGKYIVTLKAIAIDKAGELKALFRERDEVPIEETNGLFLSAAVWVNEEGTQPDLPMRGETIHANIDYVANKEKTAKLLRVVGDIKLQKAVVAETIDMETFFSEEDATVSEDLAAAALASTNDEMVH